MWGTVIARIKNQRGHLRLRANSRPFGWDYAHHSIVSFELTQSDTHQKMIPKVYFRLTGHEEGYWVSLSDCVQEIVSVDKYGRSKGVKLDKIMPDELERERLTQTLAYSILNATH